jgi:hypothetical protein
MSFKPDISQTLIFNEALALLPADPVQDKDENSPEARECRRFYTSVVGSLLELYHWNLATKRGDLAAIPNDRATEWGYAFAKPADMAYPKSVLDLTGQGWSGWTFQSYAYMIGNVFGDRPLFMQNGSTIYSRIEFATLEYTSFDITEADFTVLFKEIVVLELAARICRAITKDDRVAADLATRAETERMRVIANDLNRNRPTYGNKPTETELVRGAGLDPNFTGNYPLDPVAHPSVTGY